MLFEPRWEYLGLDISDRSLKAVQLRRTFRGHLALKGLAHIDLPAGVITDGDIANAAQFDDYLRRLLTHPQVGTFTTTYTVASLPETKTFIKLIDIPPMAPEEIGEAVRWEAEHHIPIPIEETYWDWQRVGAPTGNARLPILLGVAPKTIVDSYTAALTAAGLFPTALEIEAVAISRSLLPLAEVKSPTATIIIDIGATRTGLILLDQGTIQFTVSLPLSGRKITETIAQSLSLSEGEAEKAKILCGLDPKKCHGSMATILHQVMDELLARIRDAMSFYQEHFPHSHTVGQVQLCGGGANFRAIDNYLAGELKLKIVRGNPWQNLEPARAPLKPSELLSFTTAIGLALRPTNLAPNHD